MRAFLAASMALLTLAVTAAQQPAPTTSQQQPTTFRTGTRIVPVPTMVSDREGRFVPDLEQEEFTVFDNGKPQEITLFDNSPQPLTVVVMLDFSISTTLVLERLKQAAEAFVLRLLPVDTAQVGAFSSKIQLNGTFTNDRDELIGSLRDLQFGNQTRMYDAIDESVRLLEPLEGRRAVLLMTDGEDFGRKLSPKAVRERAQRANVMVYGVGLRLLFEGRWSNPDGELKKMAEATGGGYFVLKDAAELGPTFTRVAQELRSLYSIGFSPTTLDGKEHKVEVRMKSSEHKARSRTSYVATAED
jgi:VWFA-related protein